MLAAIAVLLTLGVVLYTLWVRDKDIPAPAPVSPTAHLEERKAAIYENLRDLQFEYRLGKLSEGDYQQTKLDLQKELAAVLAEIDRVTGSRPAPPKSTAPATAPAATAPSAQPGFACARCGARFPQPMKFCGECGSPMAEAGA